MQKNWGGGASLKLGWRLQPHVAPSCRTAMHWCSLYKLMRICEHVCLSDCARARSRSCVCVHMSIKPCVNDVGLRTIYLVVINSDIFCATKECTILAQTFKVACL